MFGLVPVKRRNELLDPFRRMDELMRRTWGDFPFGELVEKEFGTEWVPSVDISETEKEITVKAELPGIDKKDIEISLDENHLIIKGEKRGETEETGKHFHRVERTFGSFYRSLLLPATVAKDKIDAAYKDGVLTVVLPKSEEAKKRVTHVKVH